MRDVNEHHGQKDHEPEDIRFRMSGDTHPLL